MTTAALITKLKKIEKEKDKNILKSIEFLLREDTKEARLRRRMIEGAIRSEEDIANGHVMSGAVAKRRLKERMAERQRVREAAKSEKRA